MDIQQRTSSAAPELSDELRRNYVQRRLQDVQDVETAIRNHDFEVLKQIGHKLRGNAASFDYENLERLAIDLEETGHRRDFLRAFELGRQFRQWLLFEMCQPWYRSRTANQ